MHRDIMILERQPGKQAAIQGHPHQRRPRHLLQQSVVIAFAATEPVAAPVEGQSRHQRHGDPVGIYLRAAGRWLVKPEEVNLLWGVVGVNRQITDLGSSSRYPFEIHQSSSQVFQVNLPGHGHVGQRYGAGRPGGQPLTEVDQQ